MLTTEYQHSLKSLTNRFMKKYLFIDRDGTLVYEPEDYQVDAINKIKFLPRVIPALLALKDLGYSLVMVSNQDGLGTKSFPLDTFTPAHEFIINTLKSQGINFEQVLICPHKPEDHCTCRKPQLGLVRSYLEDQSWNRKYSYFIGDRDTDLQMAKNMGITGLRVCATHEEDKKQNSNLFDSHSTGLTWDEITTKINIALNHTPKSNILEPIINISDNSITNDSDKTDKDKSSAIGNSANNLNESKTHRIASVERNTKETQIAVRVDLDQVGGSSIHTGIGFFNHMLDQIATHACFNLQVLVKGDLDIDSHHTIEDTAIALGSALKEALGNKRGIGRFGFVLPMDEVMAKVFAVPDGNLLYLSIKGEPQIYNYTNQDRDPAVNESEKTITVALDISGRPHVKFDFHADFTREEINGFETQMVSHFFESLAIAMGLTLHMSVTRGNAHHQVEALFKAFGRALRPAIKIVSTELPSSKGTL